MHELKLHTSYCESFGISLDEMRATPEKQGKKAHVSLRALLSSGFLLKHC
jgi:thiaminase